MSYCHLLCNTSSNLLLLLPCQGMHNDCNNLPSCSTASSQPRQIDKNKQSCEQPLSVDVENYVTGPKLLPDTARNAKPLPKLSTGPKILLGLLLVLVSSTSIFADGLILSLFGLLLIGLRNIKKLIDISRRKQEEVASFLITVIVLIALLVSLSHSNKTGASKDGLVVVLATPQIPAQWQKCELNRCKNNGLCFQDGMAEFCVCSEGYGGKQCERLIDAIFFLDQSMKPATLIGICKLAIFLFILAFLAALAGWLCCCLKHFNARRLYLNNLRLARDNSELRQRSHQQTLQSQHLIMGLKQAMLVHKQDELEDDQSEDNNTKLFRQIQKLYIEASVPDKNGPSTRNIIKLDEYDNDDDYKPSKVVVIKSDAEGDVLLKNKLELTEEQ